MPDTRSDASKRRWLRAPLWLLVVAISQPAMAYESVRTFSGQRLDFQSTTDVMSATATSTSVNGGSVVLTPVDLLSATGGASGPYTPAVSSSTSSWRIENFAANCVVPGNGSQITCGPTGTLTITFTQPVTNPVFHMSGLGAYYSFRDGGGNVEFSVGFNSQLRLTGSLRPAGFPVPTLSLANGNANFSVPASDTVSPVQATPNPSCNTRIPEGAGQPFAGCGSFVVNGTFTQLTFAVRTLARMHINNVGRSSYTLGTAMVDVDAFTITPTLAEDFNDGAASFGAVGQAASHLLGNLRIGSGFSADNLNTANATTSPYSTIGADADEFSWPTLVRGVASTVTVPLSNASAGGNLCGWVDFDGSGGYSAGEGRCTTFASGASSAALSFTPPATGGAVTRTARLRVDYGSDLTTSTWAGRADSGEVEDASVSINGSADLSITKTDNQASYTPGGIASYVLHACNTNGPGDAAGAAISDALPAGATLTGPWTCAVSAGAATCSAASGGSAGGTSINLTASLPLGGCVDVTVPVRFSPVSSDY